MNAAARATRDIIHIAKQRLESQTTASPLLTSPPAGGDEDGDESAEAEPRADSVVRDTPERDALMRFVTESINNDTGDVTKGDDVSVVSASENEVESSPLMPSTSRVFKVPLKPPASINPPRTKSRTSSSSSSPPLQNISTNQSSRRFTHSLNHNSSQKSSRVDDVSTRSERSSQLKRRSSSSEGATKNKSRRQTSTATSNDVTENDNSVTSLHESNATAKDTSRSSNDVSKRRSRNRSLKRKSENGAEVENSVAFSLYMEDLGGETLAEDETCSQSQSKFRATSRQKSRGKSMRSSVESRASLTSSKYAADVDEADAVEVEAEKLARKAEKMTSTKLGAALDSDDQSEVESVDSPKLSPIRAVRSRKWSTLKTSYRPGSLLTDPSHPTPPTVTKRSNRSRRVLSKFDLNTHSDAYLFCWEMTVYRISFRD